MLRPITVLTALVVAIAQDCDKIPAWAKQSFCRASSKCCDAASSRRLAVAAFQGEKKYVNMSMFAMRGEKRIRSIASLKRQKKLRSAKMLDRWQRDGPLTNIVKVSKLSMKKSPITPTNLYDVK